MTRNKRLDILHRTAQGSQRMFCPLAILGPRRNIIAICPHTWEREPEFSAPTAETCGRSCTPKAPTDDYTGFRNRRFRWIPYLHSMDIWHSSIPTARTTGFLYAYRKDETRDQFLQPGQIVNYTPVARVRRVSPCRLVRGESRSMQPGQTTGVIAHHSGTAEEPSGVPDTAAGWVLSGAGSIGHRPPPPQQGR